MLIWNAVANAISYNVEYKKSTDATWIPFVTGTTSRSTTLGGLLPSTGYDWRVFANCSAGTGKNYAQQSFTTTAICNDVYEPNNNSSQAKPINMGASIKANISSATDVDWFNVTMPGNSNVVLTVSLSNLPADYDLYVYNKNLVQVGSSTTTGNESVTFNARGNNLTYYIKVVGKNGVFNTSQCYTLVAYVSSGITRQQSHLSDLPDEVSNVPNGPELYPNPASEFIYLHFNSAYEEATEIDILNSLGQIVKRHPVCVARGYNQVKIPTNEIRPGIYLLRISKSELNMMRKFVIAR